jgi:GxxExxY protein
MYAARARTHRADHRPCQSAHRSILVDRQVVVEIKAVAQLVPAHDAQVLRLARMRQLRVGLLFNFHARLLKNGLRRFIV